MGASSEKYKGREYSNKGATNTCHKFFLFKAFNQYEIKEYLWESLEMKKLSKKDSSSKSRKILGFHNAELIKYFNLSLEKNCPQIIFSFIIFHEKGRINHKGVNSSLFYPNFLAFLHFKILN